MIPRRRDEKSSVSTVAHVAHGRRVSDEDAHVRPRRRVPQHHGVIQRPSRQRRGRASERAARHVREVALKLERHLGLDVFAARLIRGRSLLRGSRASDPAPFAGGVVDHTCTVLSAAPVTNAVPSGDIATAWMGPVCAL